VTQPSVLLTGRPMWHAGTCHISTDGGQTALCGITPQDPSTTTDPGCGTCLQLAEAADSTPRPVNCHCGRTVSTLPGGDGLHCAEHDLPVSTPRRTR